MILLLTLSYSRFPSTANVARRQAEQKERLERGEVLYEPKKRFGMRFQCKSLPLLIKTFCSSR